MDSSVNHHKQGILKKHLNRFTHSHEFLLELSIITTLLVCLNFWSSLPDWGIDPIAGKIIAALGILIFVGMIAFRFKWPLLVAMIGMMVYLGINHLQNNDSEIKAATNTIQNNQNESNSLGINNYYHEQ